MKLLSDDGESRTLLNSTWSDMEKKERSCFRNPKKRKHCCIVAGGIIAVSILALVFIIALVGPRVADDLLNESELNFISVQLSYNSDNNSFALASKADIKAPTSLTCSVSPAILGMYFDDSQNGSILIGTLNMPGYTLSSETTIEFESVLNIHSIYAFGIFGKALLQQPSIYWSLVGDLRVSTYGFGFSFSFNKTLYQQGLSGLPNVTMRVFDLSQSTPTSINVFMEVEVNNPTVFSFTPLGDLQFFIQYQGVYMGTLYAINTNIYSGSNLISMFGSLTPTNLTQAGFLISRYFSGLTSTVSAVSTKNASSIILYDAALEGLELSTNLEGNASALVSSVEFVSLSVLPNINNGSSSNSDFSTTDGFVSFFHDDGSGSGSSSVDENNSVILNTVAIVTVANPLGSNSPITILNTSLSASLLYAGDVVGTFSTPLIPIVNGSASTIQLEINSVMYLADNGTNFDTFLKDFVYSNSISTQLLGNISVFAETAIGVVFLQGLPLNNTVVLKGLQGLPNTTINSFALPYSLEDGSIALDINATIMNPSEASVNLGEATFSIFYAGDVMGEITSSNLQLEPGSNELILNGFIKPQNLTTAGYFFSSYLQGRDTEVTCVGLSAGLNIGWVRSVVKNLEFNTILPGTPDTLIDSVAPDAFSFNFVTPDNDPLVNATMTSVYSNPFGFSFSILTFNTGLEMIFNDTFIGVINFPETPVINIDQNITFSCVEQKVNVTNFDGFSDFLTALILQPNASLSLAGKANVGISCSLGNISLFGLPFHSQLVLEGMNSFKDPPIGIVSTDISAGYPNTLALTLELSIFNPSITAAQLGLIGMAIYRDGILIGNSTILEGNFVQGFNYFPSVSYLVVTPNDTQVVSSLLSAYLEGKGSAVRLEGTGLATNPLLTQAFTYITTDATMPGLNHTLITFALLEFDLGEIIKGKIPTVLTLSNPFSTPFSLTYLNFNIIYKNKTIAAIQDELTTPITIGASTTGVTPPLPVGIVGGLSISFFQSLIGNLSLSVNGSMTIEVPNGFVMDVLYEQDNIPASFRNPSRVLNSEVIQEEMVEPTGTQTTSIEETLKKETRRHYPMTLGL